MQKYLILAAVIIFGYLLGNINFAIIISRLKKGDIRKADSGNPGTMNMIRNYGKKIGAITLVLDALKGMTAAVLGFVLFKYLAPFNANLGMFIGGTCAIVGHIYPVFLKFKGGKGIATTIGVCMIVNPIAAIISLAAGTAFLFLTSLGAIASFIIITPPLAICGYLAASSTGINSLIIPILATFIVLLTLWRHRVNIKKLFSGKENKTRLIKKKG